MVQLARIARQCNGTPGRSTRRRAASCAKMLGVRGEAWPAHAPRNSLLRRKPRRNGNSKRKQCRIPMLPATAHAPPGGDTSRSLCAHRRRTPLTLVNGVRGTPFAACEIGRLWTARNDPGTRATSPCARRATHRIEVRIDLATPGSIARLTFINTKCPAPTYRQTLNAAGERCGRWRTCRLWPFRLRLPLAQRLAVLRVRRRPRAPRKR